MKWAIERIVEFMFALMMLVGAAKLGMEIKEYQLRDKYENSLREARDRAMELQDAIKEKKLIRKEVQRIWIECQ